jgi:hypothetical protein
MKVIGRPSKEQSPKRDQNHYEIHSPLIWLVKVNAPHGPLGGIAISQGSQTNTLFLYFAVEEDIMALLAAFQLGCSTSAVGPDNNALRHIAARTGNGMC